MSSNINYISINKESWNNRVDAHVDSEFYDTDNFLKGRSSLNDIELNLLGDVSGKSILHLQCHFGQDSISLSRLGANVTGVDLSDKAINKAKELALAANTDTQFICCDIYDLPNHLNEQFDIVFTSYGTIGWLPDLNKWANLISTFLKPNGQFVFVEFHPVIWMFDYDFNHIAYNYFNDGPIVETRDSSYTENSSGLQLTEVSWNHSLSDVISSLIKNNITIRSFQEFDYSPYNCFNKTVEIAPKQFRIQHLDNKIPMVYSIVGIKH